MKKIMIVIPCRDKIDVLTVQSIFNLKGDQSKYRIEFRFGQGTLVYDTRNKLARNAVEEGFDYVLWIDSDMVFRPDLLLRMAEVMDNGVDYLSALCFRRVAPFYPVVYKDMGWKGSQPYTEVYGDYPEDALFEIVASGFGCVMTSVAMLKTLLERYGVPFSPQIGFGEDLTFCANARQAGFRLYCHSGIQVGHIGMQIIDEALYKAVNGGKK